MPCHEGRPFCLGLLHAVFAEDALARGNDRRDLVAPNVFDIAINVTVAGLRPHSAQARAMSAFTAASAATEFPLSIG